MTEADIPGSNLLVQTSCEDHTTLQQTGQDIRRGQTVGQVDGSHAVSLGVAVGDNLGQAEVDNGGLDLVRSGLVESKALRHRAGGDLAEGGVQGVNELGGRGGKVRRLASLVVLHDGEPVGDGGVVGGGRGLTGLGALDGATGTIDDAQTGRASDGLLRSANNHIEVPLVEGDLFGSHTADTVDNDEGVRADAADELGHALDVVQDTGGGVDVRNGQQFDGIVLEEGLDLVEGGALPERGGIFQHLGSIGGQALSERIAEVTSIQDEGMLVTLNQVGSDQIPTEGTGTGDEERLGGGVGGLEDLAKEGQGLAEDLDEAGSNVALTVYQRKAMVSSN